MPDILTRGDKSYTEILKELQSKPHTVYAGRYYCLRVGYVWYLQETHCRNCGAQITHFEQGKENSLLTPENASERNSEQSSHIPAGCATPETITVSLPALRSVILGVIDDGSVCAFDKGDPYSLWHPFPDVANDARMRLCDELERRLRQLPARG